MRALALAAGVAIPAVVLTACDGGATEPPFLVEISPTSTETVAASPSPVATIPPAEMESFRAFGQQIEAAVAAGDVDFFINTAEISTFVCPNGIEPRCEDQPAGTTIEGIWLGRWGSDATLATTERFREAVAGYLETASDPELHAIAALARDYGPAVGSPAFFAVVTSVPDGAQSTRVFDFVIADGDWHLLNFIIAGTPRWLDGTCIPNCYDRWERWESAP